MSLQDFTPEELESLSKSDNLHILIHGKVYAISKFIDEHPGGDEVLLGEAGKDATEAFEDVGHSDEARKVMEEYLVGTCKTVCLSPVLVDIQSNKHLQTDVRSNVLACI